MRISNSVVGVIPLSLVLLTAPVSAGARKAPALGRAPVAAPAVNDGLNRYQRGLLERYLSGNAQLGTDTLSVIAFQVQFADSLMGGQPGSHRTEVRDTTWFSNELGHLADYFRGASRGHLFVDWTLDPKLYTLPKEMGYYGRDIFEDVRVVELVATLIDSADASVDFSQYDHVFIIHAGAGQETDLAGDSRTQIWSSFYDADDIDAADPDTTLAGIPTNDLDGGETFLVDNFSIVPANSSQDFTFIGTLGIWAFELASRVGLLPLFDSTPEAQPDSQGVGSFCVMAFGLFNVNGYIPSFPCAFNRIIAGWLEPVTVQAGDPVDLRLADVNTGAADDTLCVRVPITENEYFLVVNRVHDANFDSLFTFVDLDSNLVPSNTDSLTNAEFDFFMTDVTNPSVRRYSPEYGFDVLYRHTGSGVYVWHVDEAVIRETLSAGYLPNDFVDRKGVDLEEADGVQDMDGGGIPAFALGAFYDSYRAGDGNQNAFTSSTDPASDSNAGIRTGIAVEDISVPGHVMTCTVRLTAAHTDRRTRWSGGTFAQAPTVANLDGSPGGGNEVAVLADEGRVYMFDYTGAEYDDADADPATVDPYIVVAGAEWVGSPAVASLTSVGVGEQLLAAATDGRLYAWNSDGTEFVDGDGDPGTDGVLYDAGRPLAAPPMVYDLLVDDIDDIVVVERDGDSLRVGFVGANGNAFTPGDPAFDPLWPVSVQGQFAAPLGLAGTGNAFSPAKVGVVLAWIDTLTSTAGVTYVPADYAAGVTFVGEPVAQSWRVTFPVAAGVTISAPAAGDIDGDEDDEVVVTTSDGRLFIFENPSGEFETVDLRAALPSAPALGDTDLDGAMEIAVWDAEFLYLLETNGRPVTEWPKPIVANPADDMPPTSVRRGLESPVIADLDGNGTIEVLFPTLDGSLRAFGHDGTEAPGFPRVGPAGATATPTVSEAQFNAPLSLVALGNVSTIAGVNTVLDTFVTVDEATLSIQSLPGSSASSTIYWGAFRGDVARTGRVTQSMGLSSASGAIEQGSFMIYPNPVAGQVVNVRVTLNTRAQVRVEVYNLEGEEALSRTFSANANGLAGIPFDEGLDVGGLVSGLYFVRLEVDGDAGSETLIKPFAIRR